jgi:hypothetical protein
MEAGIVIALAVGFGALIAVGGPSAPTVPAPTVTRGVCHRCVEDTPTSEARRRTLTGDESAVGVTRAADLAATVARPTTPFESNGSPAGFCASPIGAVLLLGVAWVLRRGGAPPC